MRQAKPGGATGPSSVKSPFVSPYIHTSSRPRLSLPPHATRFTGFSFARVIRSRFIFSGKNDVLTPEFLQNDELTPEFLRELTPEFLQRLISLSTLHNGGCPPSCKTRFRLLARLFRAGLVTRRVPAKGFTVVTLLLSRASWRDVSSSFWARTMHRHRITLRARMMN